MCKLIEEYKKNKTFTGYKIVYINKDGKILSPVMGIEYKEGEKIPKLDKSIFETKEHTIYPESVWVSPAKIISDYFEEKMIGKTGVFVSKYAANSYLFNEILKLGEEKVVKITISGNLMKGYTAGYTIVAGEKIEKIEEL